MLAKPVSKQPYSIAPATYQHEYQQQQDHIKPTSQHDPIIDTPTQTQHNPTLQLLTNLIHKIKQIYSRYCSWSRIFYTVAAIIVLINGIVLNTYFTYNINTMNQLVHANEVYYNNLISNKTMTNVQMEFINSYANTEVFLYGSIKEPERRRIQAKEDQEQYMKYNGMWDLDGVVQQSRMCVVVAYRNLLKYGANGPFHRLLLSLNSQNYTNYHLYLIDDASTDNSLELITTKLKQTPYVYNRLTMIRNKKSVGKLGSIDTTIRRFCHLGDIVLDLDINSQLLGKQVFNLLNRVYKSNADVWFVYTDYMSIKFKQEDFQASGSGGKQAKGSIVKNSALQSYQFKQNNYRAGTDKWVTGPLHTFLFDLYNKIPVLYFLEEMSGRYYIQGHDKFIVFALIQLAGPTHTKYLDICLYLEYSSLTDLFPCYRDIVDYYIAEARILKPFKPLRQLTSRTKQNPVYEIPAHLIPYYFQKESKAFECIKARNDMFHAWP